MDTNDFLKSLSEEQKAAFAIVRDELKAMYSDVETTLKTAHDSIAIDLQATIDEQATTIATLNASNNAQKTDVESLEKTRDALTSKLKIVEASNAEYIGLLAMAHGGLESLESKNATLETQLATANSQLAAITTTLDKAAKRVKRLEKDIESMDAHPDVVADKKAKAKKAAREQIKEAEKIKKEAEAKLAELEPANP